MRVRLLDPDRDLDLQQAAPPNADDLTLDLGLESVWRAMSAGDPFVETISRHVLLRPLTDTRVVRRRQEVVADALRHPEVVRELYALASQTLLNERRVYRSVFSTRPGAVLEHGVGTLEILLPALRRLRDLGSQVQDGFQAGGWVDFFSIVRAELDETYLTDLASHLARLRLRGGVVLGAWLGLGNRGTDYVLRRPRSRRRSLRELLPLAESDAFAFQIAERDEAGAVALGDLRDHGINQVADTLGRATDQVLLFFALLRAEMAFLIGAINLHDRLAERRVPRVFGEIAASPTDVRIEQLFDLALLLDQEGPVTPNDLDTQERWLVVVTGANQGGKSTFLRSLGIAQLALQAGLFVPARSFRAGLATAIFTHYRREEDNELESGKLDEELRRMHGIVHLARPGALLLSNESFASTNEREGSEIAAQVVRGLVGAGVRVVLVTHLYELASDLVEGGPAAVFLRAERAPDGTRSHRILPGPPLPTSFGGDLYRQIFGSGQGTPPSPSALAEG